MDIKKNLSNLFGSRIERKLIIIESDDWGSIRMPSLEVFDRLKKYGFPVDKSHFNLYDSIESNDDMTTLFETLSRFKDRKGNYPVITGVNVVANPDFDAIKRNGFQSFEYEPYTETLKQYKNSDKVYDLWKEGIEKKVVYSIFHGREHLNVQRWMRYLRSNNTDVHYAFENKLTGFPKRNEKLLSGDLQAAFDIDFQEDIEYLKIVLDTGLDLFEELYGYKSEYFVPTNGWFNNMLEKTLYEKGVKYVNTSKIHIEPLGNGNFRKHYRYIGKKNKLGQTYITRNCFFEPSSNQTKDWIGSCLKEIEIAFNWKKPAVISTHRVNFIGRLHPENRDNTHKQLSELLTKILKIWPDVEFVTSVELGNIINK